MRYIFFGDENFHDDIAVRLANAGFERCADIEEASAIITFCTSQSALEDAYFDEGGFVQSAHPGAVLIDFSASTPGFARELGAVATVKGFHCFFLFWISFDDHRYPSLSPVSICTALF